MGETNWSKHNESCRQRGTKRFRHVGKGLCTRCYRLVRKLEQVKLWDFDDPKTLKGCPPSVFDPEEFRKVKSGVTLQLEERLSFLRIREQSLKEPVDGSDVEYRLRHIAQLSGARDPNLFYGIAGFIDSNFDIRQKKILYELFNQIEENIPWKGINWHRVFDPRWHLRFRQEPIR